MTDGQYFYLVAVCVFLAACLVEHLWKRWHR